MQYFALRLFSKSFCLCREKMAFQTYQEQIDFHVSRYFSKLPQSKNSGSQILCSSVLYTQLLLSSGALCYALPADLVTHPLHLLQSMFSYLLFPSLIDPDPQLLYFQLLTCSYCQLCLLSATALSHIYCLGDINSVVGNFQTKLP